MKILEKHIEQTSTQLLEADGWRSLKMEQNFSERKRKLVGEAGMPDRLYIRYGLAWGSLTERIFIPAWVSAQVLWIEWKRPKGKFSKNQEEWHRRERLLGALTMVAGVDFPASIEGFAHWYADSGLCRNPSLLTNLLKGAA